MVDGHIGMILLPYRELDKATEQLRIFDLLIPEL
jgi:hypothetical protein